MRIRRPQECYHVVYFRGRFWEVDEGGGLPKGMPFRDGCTPILYYFSKAFAAPLKPGWHGGYPWSDPGSSPLKRYFGTHRRKAMRWLKAQRELPRDSTP